MPALDHCEPQVIRAFEKQGWQIFKKPHLIPFDTTNLWADASFQRIRENIVENIIVVEVKCFSDPNEDLPAFYTAQGQYNLYRSALKMNNMKFPLYLAVPDQAYQRLIQHLAVVDAIQTLALKLVIVNLMAEEIVEWIV